MKTQRSHRLVLVLLLIQAGCGTPKEAADNLAAGGDVRRFNDNLYSVSSYDPQADPAQDLARTITQATASGKRIILEIGGNW